KRMVVVSDSGSLYKAHRLGLPVTGPVPIKRPIPLAHLVQVHDALRGKRGTEMKITVLLKYDHEAVKSLFNNYKKGAIGSQNRKRELFEVIRRELMIHSEMEREIFYRALR